MSAKEPKIEYPRKWLYKIVGYKVEEISAAIAKLMGESQYSLTPSNKSRTGKYCSMDFTVTVNNQQDRDEIYKALKSNPAIKLVM